MNKDANSRCKTLPVHAGVKLFPLIFGLWVNVICSTFYNSELPFYRDQNVNYMSARFFLSFFSFLSVWQNKLHDIHSWNCSAVKCLSYTRCGRHGDWKSVGTCPMVLEIRYRKRCLFFQNQYIIRPNDLLLFQRLVVCCKL